MRIKLPNEKALETKEEFKEFSDKFQKKNKMPFAYALGICFKDTKGNTIAHKWLTMNFGENMGTASAIMHHLELNLDQNPLCYVENLHSDLSQLMNWYFPAFRGDKGVHLNIEALTSFGNICFIAYADESILKEQEIQSIADAHFRLAAISRLHYKPNTLCLDKLFTILPTVVYLDNDNHHHDQSDMLNFGPRSVMTVDEWNRAWIHRHYLPGTIVIDKIPLLVWGAPIPEGVRMPNSHSARLGAYLSPGTTIMHYGFVNFNAGTLGKAMVEGTIAAGVTIDDGTDIGKGGGFFGTLSGGNTLKVSAGKNCLIGALAECGIPLGDNCVVAAGVVFTDKTPVFDHTVGYERKAIELANVPNITFRRNSKTDPGQHTGAIEVIPKGNKARLNKELHKNSSSKKR